MSDIEDWEAVHQSRSWGRWPSIRFVEFVKRNYPEPSREAPPKFIELGSGGGAQLRFLRDEGYLGMGIEASMAAAQRAMSDFGLMTLVGDIRQLTELVREYDVDPPDCIFDVCTLQHLGYDEARGVLLEAQTLLAPGGRIFTMQAAEGTWAADDGIPTPRLISAPQLAAMFNGGDLQMRREAVDTLGGPSRSHLIAEWQKV